MGSFEAPEEDVFGRITGISIGLDHSIYVADQQLASVRQYTADGRFTRNIGSRGEGPGEYWHPLAIKALPDGNLAVLDSRPHRVILYTASGEYIRDFKVPIRLHSQEMYVDNEGYLYVKDTADAITSDSDWPMVLVKFSATGELVDRLRLPRINPATPGFALHTSDGVLGNFVVSTRYAWSPLGYLVVGRNDEYTFEIQSTQPVWIRRDIPRIPVSAPERVERQAWARYFAQSGHGDTSYPTPDLKPAFKDIVVGMQGRVWIHRHVEAENRNLPARPAGDKRPLIHWREPTTFDIYEVDGTFLATIGLPRDFRPFVMRGRDVWGVLTTETGERVLHLHIVEE